MTKAAIDQCQDSKWNSDTREFKDQFDLFNKQVYAEMTDDIIGWMDKDVDSVDAKED